VAAGGWAGQGTAPADQDQDSAWAPAEDQAARELVVVGEPAEAAALACPELAGAALPTCGSQVCREALAVARERALVVTEVVVGPARDRALVFTAAEAEPAAQAELAVEVAEEEREPAVGLARDRALVVTAVEAEPAAQAELAVEVAEEEREPAVGLARDRALVVTAVEAEPAVVPERERAAVVTVVELGPVAEEAAQVEEDLEAAAEAQEPAAE